MRAFKRSFAVSARYDKRCVVCVFAMDAVAAAALVAENAALHDELEEWRKQFEDRIGRLYRRLYDSYDLNDALIQQRDTLRQQRKELKANLRWQAVVNSELHKEVAVLSSSIARLLRRR